jgi:hypothetical protein
MRAVLVIISLVLGGCGLDSTVGMVASGIGDGTKYVVSQMAGGPAPPAPADSPGPQATDPPASTGLAVAPVAPVPRVERE